MTSANRLAECVKPVVEQLEGRTLMSITVYPLFTDGTDNIVLYIRGDSKNDTLNVVDDPIAQEVRLVKNGVPQTIPYPGGDPINTFDIDLLGGNDTITFNVAGDPTGPVYVGQQRSISLDGDVGNDTISMTIPGGIVDGSDITVDIDGDSGNDNLDLHFNYLRDAKLDVDVKGYEGNDRVLVDLPAELSSDGQAGPNYQSVLFFDVDLGNGSNVLNLNAAAGIYLDSVADLNVKGGNTTGSSYDTINIDLTNSTIEGKLFLDVNAMSGDDRINLLMDNFYVQTYSEADNFIAKPTAMIALNGNDGKDQIKTDAPNAGIYVDSTGYLSFSAKGGNGDDKITTRLTGPVDVEAGGQFIVLVDGQNNNDTIDTQIFFGDNLAAGGTGGGRVTLQVLGGQNADTINLLLTDLSTDKIKFGPGAAGALIDGQTNTDKITAQLVNLGTQPVFRNFEQRSIVVLP